MRLERRARLGVRHTPTQHTAFRRSGAAQHPKSAFTLLQLKLGMTVLRTSTTSLRIEDRIDSAKQTERKDSKKSWAQIAACFCALETRSQATMALGEDQVNVKTSREMLTG